MIGTRRPSRRSLRDLLRVRTFFNAIKNRPHAEFPTGLRPTPLDETGTAASRAILVRPSDRGRRSLVPESPVLSWTRGASKTPTGAKGGNAPEHAC